MKRSIALAQISPAIADVPRNIDKHIAYIDDAIEADAGMIVFPELSLTGYTLRDSNFEVALRPGAEILDPLRERSDKITIVCGGVEESEEFGVYNAAFVFDKGGCSTYRKIYPPDYAIFEEGRYFLPGKHIKPMQTAAGKIGVLVCEDLWHLSLPLLYAYQGVQLLIVISASPTRMPGAGGLTNHEYNSQHHATVARLLSMNLVFVNRVGFEDGVNFWGCSQYLNAHGDIVATADEFEEELLIVESDDMDVRDARRFSRHFLDDDPVFMHRQLARIIREQE